MKPKQKRQIGLYGGTFDPIHFGHINLAIEMYEKGELDEILFCPNYISPLKVENPPLASAKERLDMTKLAIWDIPYFSLWDEEVKKGGISYTIDTIKALKKKFTDSAVRLIVAEDAMSEFTKWKDYKEILQLAPLLIGSRSALSQKGMNLEIARQKLILTRNLEISSTDIRERLKKGLYCGHLMPLKVLDYIKQNSLYL